MYGHQKLVRVSPTNAMEAVSLLWQSMACKSRLFNATYSPQRKESRRFCAPWLHKSRTWLILYSFSPEKCTEKCKAMSGCVLQCESYISGYADITLTNIFPLWLMFLFYLIWRPHFHMENGITVQWGGQGNRGRYMIMILVFLVHVMSYHAMRHEACYCNFQNFLAKFFRYFLCKPWTTMKCICMHGMMRHSLNCILMYV